MPLYDYECAQCDTSTQEMRKIDERHEAPECYVCKQSMKLMLAPVRGIVKDPAVPRRVK